jgi:outer membrane protein OmpA-like peptidoglycan-associated protein
MDAQELARRAAAGLLAVPLLAACSGTAGTAAAGAPAADCPAGAPAPAGLVLVVGVHQNVPAPGVPAALACPLRAALEAGSPVAVVGLDGTPAVEVSARVPAGQRNDVARQDDIAAAENAVVAAANRAAADSDGADLVDALAVAADAARSAGAPAATITVIDSGLPDRGALDMTVPGMLAADPAEVADHLAAQMPDLTGMAVQLVGTGYTAPPQQPLSPAQRQAAADILTALLTRSGASVQALPAPRDGTGSDTAFTTRSVPLPAPAPFTPAASTVYDDASALGFLPDSTVLRDPSAASAQLAELARWLRADPSRTATITGTCASDGTSEGRARLSLARAQTIAGMLQQVGVPAAKLQAAGAGYIADPPDRGPDGRLEPALAAQNRTVRITTGG